MNFKLMILYFILWIEDIYDIKYEGVLKWFSLKLLSIVELLKILLMRFK